MAYEFKHQNILHVTSIFESHTEIMCTLLNFQGLETAKERSGRGCHSFYVDYIMVQPEIKKQIRKLPVQAMDLESGKYER